MGFFKKLKVFWKCRKEIILSLKIKVDFIAFQKNWREKNCHNGTTAANKFDSSKVIVGDSTYGRLRVLCWDNPKERLVIGNYYSIAEDVSFLLGGGTSSGQDYNFSLYKSCVRRNGKRTNRFQGAYNCRG